MLSILPKLPLFKSFRSFGFPRIMPMSLTVSLTTRCNSRCRTCNIYKRKSEEFSLDEYNKVFMSIGEAPHWITFSGGEPFLREDIAQICINAYKTCKPHIINIPTNGILTDRIEHQVTKILNNCPDASVIINLSIDGIGEQHDEIRGVRGCFDRAMETYARLRALRYDNFTLGIHTVISSFNVHDMPNIYKRLKELTPDSYITEIAEERVELGTVGAGITPSPQEYSKAIDFILEDMKAWEMKNISKITRAFRKGYYESVKLLLKEQEEVLPCYAAVASCQIMPDGEVWNCCIRAESMGNLKETGYDFRKIWFSERAERLRKEIKDRNCFCPLANVSYTNMLLSLKAMFRVTMELMYN